MTWDQYWYGDPLMVRAFYKAEKLRQERADNDAWLHGLYVLKAIDASIGNAFRKGEPAEYPAFPFSTKQDVVDEYEQEREAEHAEAWMNQFVAFGKSVVKEDAPDGN